MLVLEDVKERVLELKQLVLAASGYRHALALARSGVLFDKVLDVVVVDVVCDAPLAAGKVQICIGKPKRGYRSHWRAENWRDKGQHSR